MSSSSGATSGTSCATNEYDDRDRIDQLARRRPKRSRVLRTLCDGQPPPSPSRKSNHHVGSRAWTRGVGRLLCSAEASGGRERTLRTPAGISPAPPGVVASLRPMAASHEVRKTHICFVLRQRCHETAVDLGCPEIWRHSLEKFRCLIECASPGSRQSRPSPRQMPNHSEWWRARHRGVGA